MFYEKDITSDGLFYLLQQLEAQSFSDFRDYKIKQFEQNIKSRYVR